MKNTQVLAKTFYDPAITQPPPAKIFRTGGTRQERRISRLDRSQILSTS